MTMNTSGQISLGGSAVGQSINLEVGNSATSQIDMGGSQCRILSQVPSGQIQMPTNFYGKTNQIYINLTIGANTNNYNIKANCPSYIAGMTNVTLTINSGVTVSSGSVGAWALDTGDGWVAGDTINVVNNGIIVGAAGARGVGQPPTDGGPGGPAFRVNKGSGAKFVLTNAGTIMGGGGGGGGGGGSGHNFYQAKGGAGSTGIGAATPLVSTDIIVNTGAIGGGGGGGGCTPSGGDGSGGGGGGGAGYGRPGAPGTNTISAPDNAQGGGLLNGGAGGSSTNWGQSGNGGNAGANGNAPPGGGGAGGGAGSAGTGGVNGASVSGGGAIYGTFG